MTVLWSRFFDFYLHHYRGLTVAASVLFLAVTILLGWFAAQEIREVVIDDFNNQQLLIARASASQLQNNYESLHRELMLLGFSPAVQYSEKRQIGRRMDIVYSSSRDEGCRQIRFVEAQRRVVHIVDADGYHLDAPNRDDGEYLPWGSTVSNPETTRLSDVMATGDGLYFTMALPVRQVSVDDAHPVATNRYAGTLVFIVDAVKFAERVAGNIRSGRSGYGWIMDNKGIFLYHMERDFIGKSAFEARSEKKPNISFSRINELQKEMLLTGKEGMSWYVSGWHRGREGEEIKKLIAYAPVRLLEGSDQHRWSVGVVAPVEEVDGALNRIQVRQVLLQGVSVVVVLLSGLFLMMLMFRWSSSLQRQVEDKTRELSRSESYLRSLIEGADDIIFTVDTAGAISSMNSYGRRFFGLGRGQLAGKMLSDLMPCGVSEKQQSIIRTVFEQGTREQATCSLVAGGSERWLSINYTGIGNDEGQVIAALGIARDITERKQIEQQMTHTEKLASIGTLAAGVAHEINNPLAIILGFTELLREQAEPGTETDEMLQTIERHGLNAKRIVENLLNFSRTSERKSDAVDLNASIETVLGVVGNTMALQQITLEKRLAPDLPKLQGESGELQQVFFNIVTNAISAMETGGVLTVTTECAGDADIRICLSDTGPGIPRDIRPKIFDPFFTTKKVGEGTGLGLSISYGIIKRYGGDIVFETKTAEEAPQSGTSFIITLPIHHE